ncbi:MAG: hypothetical protein WCC36_02930 [Gammaproteobacteria bacterium]
MNNRQLHTTAKGLVRNTVLPVLLPLALAAGATGVQPEPSSQQWQHERLFHPIPQQLAREQRGSVFIYDGLTEHDIEAAMGQQFDRVGSMMFVNTVKTRETGTEVSGPEIPEPEADDDDEC